MGVHTRRAVVHARNAGEGRGGDRRRSSADVMWGGGVGQHAKCRPLREELYRAFITRASSGGSDNGPIIERILVLRRERAELLGFSNHAEVRGPGHLMLSG